MPELFQKIKMFPIEFELGDKVKIKPNGKTGSVAAIYKDKLGLSVKVGFLDIRENTIEEFGSWFHASELEKLNV